MGDREDREVVGEGQVHDDVRVPPNPSSSNLEWAVDAGPSGRRGW